MRLSLDKLQAILPGKSFLDHKKENLMSICPWCHGNEWGISLAEGHRFNCFRKAKCGETGNIFKLLKKLDRLDLLQDSSNVKIIRYDQRLENIIEKKVEDVALDLKLENISPPLGWKRIYSNYYLENRNFESFDKYEMGITKLDFKLRDHIITLIREAGEIKAYIARIAKTGKELKELEIKLNKRIPRYRNSETDFTKLLVGYDEIIYPTTTTVILVENGIYGKENVDKILGLDYQDTIKCCGTSGAKISPEQIFKLQLKGVKHILLFHEADVINKIKKHALQLLNEFESVKILFCDKKDENGKFKDPADLNEEEMKNVYYNPIDPINFYFNKVQVLNLK